MKDRDTPRTGYDSRLFPTGIVYFLFVTGIALFVFSNAPAGLPQKLEIVVSSAAVVLPPWAR